MSGRLQGDVHRANPGKAQPWYPLPRSAVPTEVTWRPQLFDLDDLSHIGVGWLEVVSSHIEFQLRYPNLRSSYRARLLRHLLRWERASDRDQLPPALCLAKYPGRLNCLFR